MKLSGAVLAGLMATACASGGSARLPGATAPAESAEPAQTDTGADRLVDAFVWSPERLLIWSDFRGRPNMASEAAAMTAYSITSEARCDEGQFSFRVESFFLPARSWVKPAHLTDRGSGRTLQHERTHFDLSEVQARRARQGLASLVSPCTLSDEARDQVTTPYLKGDAEVQAQYDRETVHGTHARRQAEWDDRVRRWLRDVPR